MEQSLTFSVLDRYFAQFMLSLSSQEVPGLYHASALLSRHVSEGNVCLDLKAWEGRTVTDANAGEDHWKAPSLSEWRCQLEASPVVGSPGDYRPLILDGESRLYLYRYWAYEKNLSVRILKWVHHPCDVLINPQVIKRLAETFPDNSGSEPDWREIAALIALCKPLTIITGSPGTGKTTAAAGILSFLIENDPTKKWSIALAAPTGKAAARLQDAIRRAKETLLCDVAIADRIPEKASTVHRLLGNLPGSPHFRHHAGNPLPADVVVVDESSMLALPMLAKLIQAMSDKARLILLGDKHQLASVEAGAVLGDLCGSSSENRFSPEMIDYFLDHMRQHPSRRLHQAEGPAIQDCIVHLQKNYRFEETGAINRISAAVNRSDGSALLQMLKNEGDESVRWFPLPHQRDLAAALKPFVRRGFSTYLGAIRRKCDWDAIFAAFETFRVLCALRQGPFGAVAMNRQIEQILASEKLIDQTDRFYAGQPVMITRNNARMRLYNGDVGLILPDPSKGETLTAVFRERTSQFRAMAPQRLPDYETVYAQTVHKSQGSEFDHVLFMLSDATAPVMTRELVYTGITRARKRVDIWSSESVFAAAVSHGIERSSGLKDALWKSGIVMP